MLGNFLSCSKGEKDAYQLQEGRHDFPRDATAEKSLISPAGENLLVLLELGQVHLELRWGPQGPSRGKTGTLSHGFRKGQSPCELRGASRESSPVGAGS